jgi:glycerophosphodiester phosphodiesterase
MQHLMGIDGVIVDLVQEITEAVSDLIKPSKMGEAESLAEGDGEMEVKSKPQFSQMELSFLLKLIPELIQLLLLAPLVSSFTTSLAVLAPPLFFFFF